jgi:Phytanoyl-CoA dioxygenase (PhyH)
MARATEPPDIVGAEETGTLGVAHLKRFWARKTAARMGGDRTATTSSELCADNVLLAGLKLGVRETLDFLMISVPSFEEFEAWVLAKNGGCIDPARVQRLNGALRGDRSFTLESIRAEPALSTADLAFWDEHGFIVVKQAVSRDQCGAAAQAIYEHAGMDINRPDSWYTDGIWILLGHHPALWANRNSPRIHTAFSQIWRRGDLWMNVDVCGVNPPLRPGYAFRGTPLHWDMTLVPPLRFGTQAVLYLTDTAANQGAFSCVPGFHRRLGDWLRDQPPGIDPRARAAQELPAIPIPGDAGDLIIWHHALPHAATPNHAAAPRVVQYLNMFPSQCDVNAEWI